MPTGNSDVKLIRQNRHDNRQQEWRFISVFSFASGQGLQTSHNTPPGYANHELPIE
jgi:hypothetical protein